MTTTLNKIREHNPCKMRCKVTKKKKYNHKKHSEIKQKFKDYFKKDEK